MKKHLFIAVLGTLLLTSCGKTPSESLDSSLPTSEEPSSETINSSDGSEKLSEETSEKVSEDESELISSESSEEINYMEQNEYLDALKQSPYQSPLIVEDQLGLTTPSIVGANEDQLINEERYPSATEGTIYLAEDYDIIPNGMNNAGNLSILLKNISSVSGNKIIKFQNATYIFTGKVDVTGIKDLYLVGEENTMFLYSGWGTYFEATLSENIHLNNIQFDMKYSPTISGTIVAFQDDANAPKITLSIPNEFDLTNTLYQNWDGYACSYMETYLDANSGRYVPDPNKNLFYNSTPSSERYKGVTNVSYNASTRQLVITLNKSFPFATFKVPALGTNVSFAYTMYDNHGFRFLDCKKVFFENINVYVTGGMGLRIERGADIYLNRTNFKIKEGSARIMTATADIIHTIALEGDLKISNSIIEASHDDGLNIKTFYTRISDVIPASREITVVQTQNEVSIPFAVGDTLDVYDPKTMGFVDTFVIESLTKVGTGYRLYVDKRPSRDLIDLNAGNATKVTKLKLENCLIQHKRNRGILLQTRDSEIVNCTFRNVVMGAVQILSVTDQFREAIVPRNIKLKNNKFLNNQGGDVSIFTYGSQGPNAAVPGTLQNVEVTNNFFANNPSVPINLRGTSEINFAHNLFYFTNIRSATLINVINSLDNTLSENVAFFNSGNYSDVNFVSLTNSTNVVSSNNRITGGN